jgi:hypothetical protein
MTIYHSHEVAEFPAGKVDGGDHPGSLINKKYRPAKDADGEHWGKPHAEVQYDGNEFFCRVSAGGRDWCFRGLSVDALCAQVERFFGARGRVKFKLSKAADLARFGENKAIGRL